MADICDLASAREQLDTALAVAHARCHSVASRFSPLAHDPRRGAKDLRKAAPRTA